ncbi:hypothetical protein BXZ70DRAFT_35820 [Cristinia sonorae]|uniref:Uncharacterized protein n=1 Tax=Cristinia sonorae TaxID=1940300 RepID=A0A8K0XUZ3_9AGAR|nr:hypothetical protein BXZ70DRAFT_35820 [Cristinia sonorae]
MPDLPGPPSSSDIEDHDDDRTPVNRSNDVLGTLNFSTMKTPRPPGAWATTPLPSERDIIVRPSSTPPYRTNGSSSTTTPSPLATTPAPRAATLSRADSLPTQTPAPPGAWLATPANSSARRKSILKVRFDIDPGELESDTSMLDVTPPPTRKVVPPSMKANGDSGNVDEKGVKRETSPKSVSVRLLDAFGRETEVLDAPSQLSSSRSPPPAQSVASTSSQHQHRPDLPPPPVTPRSKSAIRIVDAMGREVEEPPEEPLKLENGFANGNGDARLVVRGRKKQEDRELDWNPDSRMVLSHNEALARVRRTIADLAGDLDEVDRSYDNLALDENRLGALEDASRAAKSARKRISDSLRYVQTAEDDLKMKFGSLRRGMNESKFLPSVQRTNGVTWARVNTWTVCAFLVIQLLLMVLMYRYSFVRARKMFLSTYYDGFNVDLYLHLTSHSPHYSPTPSNPFSWSSETTWSDVWGNVTTLVGDWAVQVVRREENVSGSWPPT